MNPAFANPDSRVVLRRESLWFSDGAGRAADRRGHFVSSTWSLHLHPATADAYITLGAPILKVLPNSAVRRLVVVRLSGAGFEAGELRRLVAHAALDDTPVMVELAGYWSLPALQVLGAIGPAFVRVGPEYIQGIGALPEQFRRLAQLAAAFALAGVPIVGHRTEQGADMEALQSAGVDLVHVTESALISQPWPDGISLGPPAEPVVLPFPLRPVMRR